MIDAIKLVSEMRGAEFVGWDMGWGGEQESRWLSSIVFDPEEPRGLEALLFPEEDRECVTADLKLLLLLLGESGA